MTRDEIIKLARMTGASFETAESMFAFADIIAAAEREACAKVCERERSALEQNREVWIANPQFEPDENYIAEWESSACRGEEYAAAVRARGEKGGA